MLFALPLTLIAVGVALVAGGLGLRGQVEPVAGWPQVTGWVAGFHASQPAGDKEPTYNAVIAFRVAGQVVTFSAPGVDHPPAVGSSVLVAYDPRDPADAHDLSLGGDWEGLIYLGAGFLVLGVALMALLSWLVFFRRNSRYRAGEVSPGGSEGRHVRGR